MTTPSAVIFSIAAVFYLLTWVYIRQLVRDVNMDASAPHVPLWRWHKGWRRHRAQFPGSPVRKRIVECIALAVVLGLIAFAIEARQMFLRL
jgi:hypothetical protein